MTAATGGLDLLVLTGGVGEHSWQVRAALAEALPHLGLAVDADRNRATTADADISAAGARGAHGRRHRAGGPGDPPPGAGGPRVSQSGTITARPVTCPARSAA